MILKKATDSFLDMLAYLPIKYFDAYKFGSRNDVMTAFSLLPPIVRYKALEYLFSVESNNIAVADKLILSVMKAQNPDKAEEWAKNHRVSLESLPVVSDQAYKEMVEKIGENVAKEYMLSAPKNMYEVCIGKINNLRGSLEKGSLYKTFEEAYTYYKKHGILEDDGTEEVREFNDMMEFLYLGRKEAANRNSR